MLGLKCLGNSFLRIPRMCLHDPLLLPFSPLFCSGHPKSGKIPTTQRGVGGTTPAAPHSGRQGSGLVGLAVTAPGGGSLTGRQACRWAHTGASCAAAGAQASCSNPSGSDQQDGPAQAEGSLQGGTLLQTEAGAPGGGRQEELPGLLSWRSSSGFRAGSDRRPFSHLPPPPPRASLAHGIIITLVDG